MTHLDLNLDKVIETVINYALQLILFYLAVLMLLHFMGPWLLVNFL